MPTLKKLVLFNLLRRHWVCRSARFVFTVLSVFNPNVLPSCCVGSESRQVSSSTLSKQQRLATPGIVSGHYTMFAEIAQSWKWEILALASASDEIGNHTRHDRCTHWVPLTFLDTTEIFQLSYIYSRGSYRCDLLQTRSEIRTDLSYLDG